MITRVVPPPGILGLGRYRTVAVIGHLCTDDDADAIVAQLADEHIPVELTRVGYTAHLRPTGPVTTEQEVWALAVVAARTDCRIAWHPAVTANV